MTVEASPIWDAAREYDAYVQLKQTVATAQMLNQKPQFYAPAPTSMQSFTPRSVSDKK